jgi:tetratricopeptide (TPR) repeat protein
VTLCASGRSTLRRWTFWFVVLTLVVGGSRAESADPGRRESPSTCDGFVPSPWPGTLVERRLNLRRMDGSREQCIGSAPFLAAYGALLLEEGDPEQARIWLERALMLDPDRPGAQADHALALAALGEPTALQELVAIWRNRDDIPDALRLRLAQAVEPVRLSQLPRARLGGLSQKAQAVGRGEASLLIGYETNLAVSPRLTELTLTPPEGSVVLPVISTPRKGASIKADLAWQTAWKPSSRDALRAGLSLSTRRAPSQSSTDWYQLQGAASFSRQWSGWTATTQADLAWFGGDLTEAYGLLRTRLLLEHSGDSCSNALQLEADVRRQSETHSADSLTSLIAWRMECRPFDNTAWQAGLTVRAATDRPNGDPRPGGVQDSWGLIFRLGYKPSAVTAIELAVGASNLKDREGYSPLLGSNTIRTQTPQFLSIEVSRSLEFDWMPGAEAVVQLTRFRQGSNLPLFQHAGTAGYAGLRWPW